MGEVRTGRGWWTRRVDEAGVIRGVGKVEFVEWYREQMVGEGRRRLSVEVVSVKDELDEGARGGGYRQPQGSAEVDDSHQLRDEEWSRIRAEWAADKQ